ncbi:hypothetical protein CMI37_34185 [Candidatus Pacearchaeota archaeon]|nr:hypothetical protein [Candidatus Pacearchaeota archaeon]|tara:strand:- start:1179 stop:1481 length:303 start_codon:yes stop_codon:yes gene_type:complete
MSKVLTGGFPNLDVRRRDVMAALNEFARNVERLRNRIAEVVSFNRVLYYSQNGEPSTTDVEDGQIAVWKDADAASTNPTHYIVYNDGGTIVTWASDNLVP